MVIAMKHYSEIEVMNKHRVEYIDIVRGVSMLCIIAGHMGNTTIMRIVFTFHVPVFFIISGLFFKNDISKIKSNSIKLIKPYVFTVLCVAILDGIKALIQSVMEFRYIDISRGINSFVKNIVAGVYGSGSRTDFLDYHVTAIGAIWFYLALIWSMLFSFFIIRITNKVSEKRIRTIIWYALSIGFWLIGYYSAKAIWLPTSIQAGFSSVIFMIFGISMKELDNSKIVSSLYIKYINLFAALLWIIALCFSIFHDYMSIVRSAFPDPIINIIGAIAATWLLFRIGQKIEGKRHIKLLKVFGEYSIVVLSFHLIELNIIPWDKLICFQGGYNWLSRIIIFIVKVLWCIIGITLARKIKMLRWIFSIKQ